MCSYRYRSAEEMLKRRSFSAFWFEFLYSDICMGDVVEDDAMLA